MMEVVEKLDAVVGRELADSGSSLPPPAFGPPPDFSFTGFAFPGQASFGAPVLPQPTPTPRTDSTTKTIAPKTVAPAWPIKSPCELERQVKRTLGDSGRCQPLVELVDRLLRDMEQTESKVLAFVSVGVSDGWHVPVLQAATLLAEQRAKRILLIDGDMARRSLSDGLEYGRCAGLAELLASEGAIQASCQPTATKQLSFVPVGQMQLPTDFALKDRLDEVLTRLKADCDCVLIDAGDANGELASALARGCDATYLVVELGTVELNTAQAALARLRAAGARVLGCVAI